MLTYKRKLILTKAQERRVLSWIGVGVMAQFGAIFAILAILALALIIVASPIYGLGLGAFLTVIVLILAAVQSVI